MPSPPLPVIETLPLEDVTSELAPLTFTPMLVFVALPPVPMMRSAPEPESTLAPETMLGLLEYVAQRYGDVAEYLIRHGMREAELAALRDRLTR